ncbi:hypothetical protein QBC34DRAFT_168591 [Podospora aff. communis PSN243]|uniref:Uncharacterized protein n=1 Tax=Podospora aff. communis PSN243 TaxID=3040156 RepID=A0AAV9GC87_9PEZI|nr:hypothetical protein QBC34DRAFT_168591 [Podospora aff. communis PSN243]
MAQPSSLSSNNPFRRNGSSASASTPVAAPPPPFPDALDSPSDVAPSMPSSDQFRAQLKAMPQTAQSPPATSFQKPKVVKKVRVQSPPPSSPESAGVPDRYSRRGPDTDESSSSEDESDRISNPFNIVASTTSTDAEEPELSKEVPQQQVPQRTPPNPFQRTLQDLEVGSKDTAQSVELPAGTRGALDVDAFKRLLLTGQAGGLGAAQAPSPAAALVPAQGAPPATQTGDGGSLTDTSSISRQSIFDATYPSIHDTPRTSHEISEPEGDDDRHGLIGNSRPKAQTPTTLRKKPPPPSSRHGKLIKVELKGKDPQEGNSRPPAASPRALKGPASPPHITALPEPTTPLEVNKPLPPAPHRHPTEEEAESIFDREAAGKVPEPAGDFVEEPLPVARPPTPTKPSSHHTPTPITNSPQAAKKPPPPPRRNPHGHARSESKASILVPAPTAGNPEELDTLARRSSQDSTRSRSSSLRVSIYAPAPPPPRRPTHNSRPSNAFVSPSAVSFSSVQSAGSEKSPAEGAEFSPLPPAALTGLNSSGSQTPSPHIETSESVTEASTATPSPLHHGGVHPKLFPPPPPPARNASTRSKRPPSVSSLDATSRRVGNPMAPPPPPPRQRGSSKGSVDGSALTSRKGSAEGVRVLEGKLAEEPTQDAAPVDKLGAAPDILADLTALQREVDALRGKVEQAGPG